MQVMALMQDLQGLQDVDQDAAGFRGADDSLQQDVLAQRDALFKIHDHVGSVVGLLETVNVDYAWIAKLSERARLIQKAIESLAIGQRIGVIDLHRA